jgi:hypothetical protein
MVKRERPGWSRLIVTRHLLGSLAPPGVLHIEQRLSLDTLLVDLADNLRLQEIRSYL